MRYVWGKLDNQKGQRWHSHLYLVKSLNLYLVNSELIIYIYAIIWA